MVENITEEGQKELDKAWDEAMEEEWKMKTLENDLTPIVKRIIAKSYPEAFNLQPEGYKAFDTMVCGHIDKLVRAVNDFASNTGEKR
ncbi:MAG TPA: hypothetical protein VLX91_03880 [Candidatus Acidoferrales bacterium]|nr:hypothetical protein [Candidatus Acidoferrales bacterium]